MHMASIVPKCSTWYNNMLTVCNVSMALHCFARLVAPQGAGRPMPKRFVPRAKGMPMLLAPVAPALEPAPAALGTSPGRPSAFIAARDEFAPLVKEVRVASGRDESSLPANVNGSGGGKLRFDDSRRWTGGLGGAGACGQTFIDLALEKYEKPDDRSPGAEPGSGSA